MQFLERILLLCMLVALGACVSRSPYQPETRSHATAPSQSAEEVLIRAIGLVGTPYRWGGNTPDSGFDCSGLIGYVYRDATGLRLPRSTREMIDIQAPSISQDRLQSGDLVFFATNGGRAVSHAGIYVGEGRFVHAPRTGGTVRLDSLENNYWRNAFLEAKRIIPTTNLAARP